jgi:hypothetical protein
MATIVINGVTYNLKRIDETTYKADISDTDLIPFAGPDGKFYHQTFTDLQTNLGGLVSGFKGAIAIADTPIEDGIYIPSESGTYTHADGIIVDLTDGLTLIVKTGSDFTSILIPIDLSGYVASDYLFDKIPGKNRFNKAEVTTGLYITTTTGGTNDNVNAKMSPWIPIEYGKTYRVSGTTDGTSWRFKDELGNLIKPVDANGNDLALWGGSLIKNSTIYIPHNAVYFQFTVQLSSGGSNLDTVQVEEGLVITAYEPYTLTDVIKPELIPGNLPYLKNGDLEPYAKTDDLLEVVNLFDKDSIIPGFYISHGNGSLNADANSSVSPAIPVDDSKTYYLSGRVGDNTIGMVFRDSSNAKMFPLINPGVQGTLYTLPSGPDGIVYVPTGAVSVQFTTRLLGVGTTDLVQLEEGIAPSSYSPYGILKIKPELLPSASESNKIFAINKSGVDTLIRSTFNNTYDVVIKFTINTATNSSLNISQAKLILKSDEIDAVGKVLEGGSIDDACPTKINGIYISGNHGNSGGMTITANSHGKTLADVGSVFTDDVGIEYYLLKIIDANSLLMISENISADPKSWNFKKPSPGVVLTYQSNGNNTNDITIASNATTQIYPSVKNVKIKFISDGVELLADGNYESNDITYLESYDVVDTVNMASRIVSNRPTGGYGTQPDFTDGETLISRVNTYKVQDACKVTLLWNWIARKEFYIDYFGGTQSAFLKPGWATSLKRYIPSSLPVSDGITTYDFRMPVNTSPLWNTMNLTSEYWENDVAPSRAVDIMTDGSLTVNLNIGFLPVGVAGDNRSNNVNNAWYLYNSGKLYPHAIDSKIGPSGLVPGGTAKQGINFRGWSEKDTSRTNLFFVENGMDTYVFIDWHSAIEDKVDLPTELMGKSITVVEKSDNVIINATIIIGAIDITVAASTPMYGYCILKIN